MGDCGQFERDPTLSTDAAYLDYLETPEWWALRRRALIRANYRCARELPNGPPHSGPVEGHHLSYGRLGMEALDDVEVLCAGCHRAEHYPRNRHKRLLESFGQLRLFDRWDLPIAVIESAA